MTGARAIRIVLVALVIGGVFAVPVAGGVQSAVATQTTAFGTAPSDSAQIAIADVQDQTFAAAWNNFTAANESIYTASAAVSGAASDSNSSGEYQNETVALRALDANTTKMDRAASNATAALVRSDLTPAQQSVLLAQIEMKRSQAERTATDAVDQYRTAVVTSRESSQSTVVLHFGGALVGGLVLGAVLGAIVPFREAKNVEEQMKLSRNVSYNRRAGLVPVAGGLLLFAVGIGLLWFLGAGDLIGVFV